MSTTRRRLKEAEMATELNIKPRTLRKWRYERIIPFEKIGYIIRFDPDAVFAALKKYERKPTVLKSKKSLPTLACHGDRNRKRAAGV
jgi:hypothetical protein